MLYPKGKSASTLTGFEILVYVCDADTVQEHRTRVASHTTLVQETWRTLLLRRTSTMQTRTPSRRNVWEAWVVLVSDYSFLSKRDLSFTASLGEAKWIRELDKGSPSAFVALLPVYLENLEAVEMSAGFQRLFSFLGPYTLKSLTRLTTASIGAFLDEVFMGPGRTSEAGSESLSSLTLFQLPKVRRLSLNIPKPLEDRKFVWPDMTSPPVNIYLTSLELAFTFLDEHDLAYVLKTCPRSRSLKYDLWTTVKDDEVTETEEAIVRLSALQQALLPVKATLETFHLHIEKYHWASGS
ncbi:hypothetical protein D6D28_02522 [Aureobasidium pullulans]|uniref:F-box domain-containing protein n=1 Tax=Aureobasidium pullulans TaxID=5580 RepID=A0A4S8SU84_AURPU|nr:hypothetical protein D6D28_02522 [Aureobasidium pullulans]